MANWKKMAEAFGRAFRRADDPTTAKSAGEVLAPAYELDPKTGEPLLDKPAGAHREAFIKGYEDAADIDRDYLSQPKGSRTPEVRDRMHESADDKRTDEALAENRKQEWDDAFDKAEQRSRREAYGDDWWDDYAKEGTDDFGSRLREVVNEMKTKGISENDILDILKRYGNK